MSLQTWQDNGWLRPHVTTRREIADLFAIVERDLADAKQSNLSPDWQFGIAYNAALKLCTFLLHAEGYRPEHTLNHYWTIAALPLVLGQKRQPDAAYLETCRRKRNVVEYDRVGEASGEDAVELVGFVEDLKTEVREWLCGSHPELA